MIQSRSRSEQGLLYYFVDKINNNIFFTSFLKIFKKSYTADIWKFKRDETILIPELYLAAKIYEDITFLLKSSVSVKKSLINIHLKTNFHTYHKIKHHSYWQYQHIPIPIRTQHS